MYVYVADIIKIAKTQKLAKPIFGLGMITSGCV